MAKGEFDTPSGVASAEYRDNWERIYGNHLECKFQEWKDRRLGNGPYGSLRQKIRDHIVNGGKYMPEFKEGVEGEAANA